METYIAILRGINVSGHRIIKMADLKLMFEELKFKNIHTYIQSGNVVFQAKKSPSEKLQNIIEKKIVELFSFEVPVIVLEYTKLEQIIANNPFRLDHTIDEKMLHVTFLSTIPEKKYSESLPQKSDANDQFVLDGSVIYLYCPNGYGNTKLTNNFFEKILKTSATTRNWKTTLQLLEIATN